MKTPDSKRRLAVLELMAGGTRPEAAKAAGVSLRTVERWLADPATKTEIEAGRRAAFAEALELLKAGAVRAAVALAGLLNSRNESIRLRAAAEILAAAMKAHETGELERRLEALEKTAAEITDRRTNAHGYA